MLEICTIGGYNEVGKNSTAVKIDNDVYILDLGIHLENYVKHTQDEDIVDISPNELMRVGAVPDVSAINDWKSSVKMIMPTHAHLDNLGALHTKEGIILYANDFKFDLFPTLGKKPNFKRLEELGKQKVLALICDSTYAADARKMP